ncbi:UNVERIFIED_CONTAM: putative mitochondrial protein [Sesamum radiatum]|uniref:Mitochondrial protein n=1 Tax=Sesamum radiatum TaxID=300843 RepID=A0AAW2TZ39_SESRA
MGFRNLHFFNLAMLAKQLWCILCHLESLLSLVLRAKYFPSGDLFMASIGSRSSFTWSSVMAALDLFKGGCRRRVGSGSLIRVWLDPWLPRPRSFCPITLASAELRGLYVSYLIDQDSGE